MTDDVAGYPVLTLKGERVSIPSPRRSPAAGGHDIVVAALDLVGTQVRAWAPAVWPTVSFCGALALWSAPGLLLYRYGFDPLANGVIRACLRGTNVDLLSLFGALAYIVGSGLLLAKTTALLAPQLGRYRVTLPFVVAPLILASLAATFAATLSLGVAILRWCSPTLL
jgi:hypothetical protein